MWKQECGRKKSASMYHQINKKKWKIKSFYIILRLKKQKRIRRDVRKTQIPAEDM